jgi:methylenetetrahydrofolate--tRNA-(uracil-5-)-methyltransferase
MSSVCIIGAGLSGCEAALVLSSYKINVNLFEMRPQNTTPAHKTDLPAELVCSNSFKSKELPSAQALLKTELKILNSPLIKIAEDSAIPAGKALAVDRNVFSNKVLQQITRQKNILFKREEIKQIPSGYDYIIIATGPLTSPALTDQIVKITNKDSLYFYDAISPIISADSIDFSKVFFASRWDNNQEDYCNCPFTKEEYEHFYNELISAKTVPLHNEEKEIYFNACLPLEVIAKRGFLALAYGPFKPIGLKNPKTGTRPFAVCQLRKENKEGSCLSLVACQTRLIYEEQKRIFRMIPGLENAEFLRFGSCHRNTYLDSPSVLSDDLSFKNIPNLFVAGQLCGNEGYVESIATGNLAAIFILNRINDKKIKNPPVTTATGALLKYVTQCPNKPFTPTSFHFGLLPALDVKYNKLSKKEKHDKLCERALQDLTQWKNEIL